VASSNLPASFTAQALSTTTTNGSISSWATLNHTSGVAYTWGTPLTVTFNPLAFLEAKAGDVLNASVSINSGAVTVPIQYTVTPPVAAISSLVPATVPVDTTPGDTVTVVVYGTGFITGPSGQTTTVTFNGSAPDPAVTVNVVSSTTITLTIPTVDGMSNPLTYLATAGTLTIAAQNPNNGSPIGSPSSMGLTISGGPIVNSMASVATYAEPAAGSNPTFAPYDVVAIFGTGFCPDCSGNNPTQVLGTPDSTYFRYPTQLSPDTNAHWVSVDFKVNSGGNALIGSGYLLFANNNQINVIVPAGVAAQIVNNTTTLNAVQVVVKYTTAGSPNTVASSAPYVINVAPTDPGILTLNANGQGQGAILLPDYSVNGSGNKASHASPQQTVMVFLGGLGVPNSTAANTTTTTALAYPGSCISALGNPSATPPLVGYMTTINTTSGNYTAPGTPWTTVDGAVIHSAFIQSPTLHFAPCITSGVTATINGVAATVTYAGWVTDAVAGLYQVNVQIPSSPGTIPTGQNAGQVPIVITIGGKSTQAGVTMYIQ